MDYQEKARRVIELEIAELRRLHERIGEGDGFSNAVDALRGAIEGGGKILIVGVGKSGNIGGKLAATLNSTGATAVVLNCQDALHGDLGIVDDGDAVIALSYSGETRELIDLLPHLKRPRLKLIAITGETGSTLARVADVVLDVNVEREACPLNLAPTSSTTNMLVLGDALAMVLLESRGFRKEDFARLHPGGSLGRALLTRADDIMRCGAGLARVAPEATVREALEAMSKARAGAVIVSSQGSDGGRLEGIFTQGDFTRAFQSASGPDLGGRPVADFMTRDPITVNSGRLAAEVLGLLEEHRIDDLVVVNEAGEPVGMIDTQDLTRLRIL